MCSPGKCPWGEERTHTSLGTADPGTLPSQDLRDSVFSAGTTNNPGLNLDHRNCSHLTWTIKHPALSWFYAYTLVSPFPSPRFIFPPKPGASMRHKCSWGGQDDIQLNLEEKEALSEHKYQCRAQCSRSWDCFPPGSLSLQLSPLDVLNLLLSYSLS